MCINIFFDSFTNKNRRVIMAIKDILGTKKVRTKPEYTAKTHWAGSINFAAIFTAPIFYIILPILVLYFTGCFKFCAQLITNLVGNPDFICNQYYLIAGLAVILWQFVVCWTVWRKQIKTYEATPKYEYHFYNDIVEYAPCALPRPKFIRVLTLLINFLPALVLVAVFGVGVLLIINSLEIAPPSTGTPGAGTGTPGTGTITPGTGAGTPGQGSGSASVNWAEIWANISGTATKIFSDIAAFLLNKDNLPIILIGALVLLVLIVILIIANSGKESSTIKMKTIPARTLPAIISATKKLPAPKYLIPDNCPRWLKKIIFWAPVHYNYGDVIISSPKGTEDDVILSAIEKPEELINYLNPIKPEPTEVAGYSAH